MARVNKRPNKIRCSVYGSSRSRRGRRIRLGQARQGNQSAMGCLRHCMQDSTPFHSKRTDTALLPRMGSLRLDSSRLSSTSLVQDGRCGDGVPHRTWVYRMLLGFPFAVPVWMSPHEQPALFLSLRTVFFIKKSERVSRFFSLNPALPGASVRGRDK